MVPPWVPDLPAGEPPPEGEDEGTAPNAPVPAPQPVQVAPPKRFLGTRLSLGEYARSGDGRAMRRALGHYVRTGYGGAGTASRRSGGTARTAEALFNGLSNVAAGRPAAPGSPLDPALLAGRSVEEVMNAVVEAVRPIDGTQDTEAARAAIRDALSELLTRFPDADLLNLDSEQRNFAIERYSAIDVFRRFQLDVGRTIVEKAPNATTALSRLKQIRDYVKETVASSFRRLRDAGRAITAGRVSQIVNDALHETFQVFEGYAE
jgi:hypothetical protein